MRRQKKKDKQSDSFLFMHIKHIKHYRRKTSSKCAEGMWQTSCFCTAGCLEAILHGYGSFCWVTPCSCAKVSDRVTVCVWVGACCTFPSKLSCCISWSLLPMPMKAQGCDSWSEQPSRSIWSFFFFQPLPIRYTQGGGQKNLEHTTHVQL